MDALLGLLSLVWVVIAFIVKIVSYIVLFMPFVGARVLQWLHLLPDVWPFGLIV